MAGAHDRAADTLATTEATRPATARSRDGVATAPGALLHLQRQAGNRAVTALVVQRDRETHTAAARIPGILAAEPAVAPFVGEGGGAAPTVELHANAAFRAAYIAYAVRNGHTQAQAEGRALMTTGFTDLDSGVIHLNQERGDPGTVVHEALHLRSSRRFIEAVAPNVNEGITEFFTRRVCAASEIARGTDSYPAQIAAIDLLVERTSVEAVATAYFQNNQGPIEAAMEAIRPGLWLDWKIAMVRRVQAANELLRPTPAEPETTGDAAAPTAAEGASAGAGDAPATPPTETPSGSTTARLPPAAP